MHIIERKIAYTIEAYRKFQGDQELISTVHNIGEACAQALQSGEKIILASGRSAADPQPIAGEFWSRFIVDRVPRPALVLTTDTSIFTACGNGHGFETVFAHQVEDQFCENVARVPSDQAQSMQEVYTVIGHTAFAIVGRSFLPISANSQNSKEI